MENNQEQNQEQSGSSKSTVQSASVQPDYQSDNYYDQRKKFLFKRFEIDKQRLLLIMSSFALLFGIINSIMLVHLLCREDRFNMPMQGYMLHENFNGKNGQDKQFFFDGEREKERGNSFNGSRELPNMKEKMQEFQKGIQIQPDGSIRGTLPGGRSFEIKPSDKQNQPSTSEQQPLN